MFTINHIAKMLLFGIMLIQTLIGFSVNQERYLHFTEIDGLPRNITTCLEQDKYGYVWIGTNNGIARFDGKNFYCYKELSGIGVIYLLYDSHDVLWAATGEGLFRYNRLTNYFDRIVRGFVSKIREDKGEVYFLMVSDIYKVKDNKILNIYQGNDISDFCFSKEGIWLAKSNDGVFLLSRESNFSKVISSYLKNKPVVLVSKIDDKLFVGCYNGQLYSISGNGKPIYIEINNHYLLKKVIKIDQEIWLATDGYGIIVLDKNLKVSRILNRNWNTNASINSNSIYDILCGSNHEIWLASYGAGLTCILPDNLLFQNFLPEKGNENALVANEGVSVFVKKPLILFGTNYGLSAWNENTGRFYNLTSDRLRKDLNGTKVTAITVSSDNSIWLGTYDGLLGKYNSDYQLQKTYHPSSNGPDEMQQIVQLREIDKSNLLIITQFHSRILLNFDTEKETTSLFELYSKGSNITYFLLNSLRENQQRELLAVISDKGLFHVNWKDNVLENRLSEMNKRIDFNIADFYHDKKGYYWFASSANGLIRISTDGKSYKKFSIKEGLPSNTLVRIESVDDRFLWISTISGIFRFDTESGEALNFNYRDGLPANEFKERVSAITNDGRIIFGSLAGFTIIDPSKVDTDTKQPEVVISDISFQNQSIRNHEGEKYIDQPLEETKEITLPFDKNSFSIHFFTKNKSFSQYHSYEFRLLGLEENWNYQGETSFTTYTNLSPGNYVFEIKSADINQLGITTRLTINISPPWYRAWYAYLAYIVLFFIILYLSIYAFLKRFELLKEKEITRIEIQKEHELTEKKLEFFTNVSHDLKTPLTLIDAPVTDLLESKNLNPEQIDKLQIIRRNSRRLYKLITDLLDFRIITKEQFKLEICETDISCLIAEVTETFVEECKNKSVGLVCHQEKSLTGYVDSQNLEKILWNLLSNALKFTPPQGTISIHISEFIIAGISHLKLVVSDTGIGISKDDKDKIFDRFYKVSSSSSVNKEGTGIGLSIVKELVEIHKGNITIDSEVGTGTTFSICIPIDKNAYSENDFATVQRISVIKNNEESVSTPIAYSGKRYNLQKILIVEDSYELRNYLALHFEKYFNVYTAEDGSMGLKIAKESNPDIILTDVQMPVMNGYEFCREIRQCFEISHVPVVMLTANNTIDQQIEGLSTGADVYMTKPFEINLLDAQIVSLLENRKSLRKKFHGVEPITELEKSLPKRDIDFINDLKFFIEENIMNPNLNVEFLAENYTVSLAQLHRKIKALTGSTPNNLIKSIRLKIAYKLIKEDGLRVSEAAYQTGFSDPNYFTTCFKKEFGENPSQIVTD